MSRVFRIQSGDELRVIAPSGSWDHSRERSYALAEKRLKAIGFKVSFGKNIKSTGRFETASVEKRLSDFHEAFKDQSVKAIFALTGGWSANELLPRIDWDLVKKNPKPLIGFSDITVLHNAIYAMTGNISLLGPNFGSLGSRNRFEYSLANLCEVLAGKLPLNLKRSKEWFDWQTKPHKTPAWKVVQAGVVQGRILGGNLGTFYLLQGTPYMPKFNENIVLLVEDDDESGNKSARELDRRLESIAQLPDARENIKGLVIGRFQPSSRVTMPDMFDIVKRKFPGVPAIAGVDFGHTKPMLSFPIGGTLRLQSRKGNIKLELVEY